MSLLLQGLPPDEWLPVDIDIVNFDPNENVIEDSESETVILDDTNNNEPDFSGSPGSACCGSVEQSMSTVVNPVAGRYANRRRSLAYPAPLPTLSSSLNQLEKLGKLVTKSREFVREAGAYLLSITNGHPTPGDYDIYSRTLVHRYKDFRDDSVLHQNVSFDTIGLPTD